MKKEQLYFEDIDATSCYPLDRHIRDAKLEGLNEITLVEAIPDDGTESYVWCSHYDDAIERRYCTKSECETYESKSGRGVCKHRGNLYLHGEEVKFIVK